ncbi:SDR family oxidoreductase [Tepidibacillus fermentans]|uniref:3-oxoacyl-[acyl-carrier protein] reductase n=1 Tax=Tepidibacillus fermentans TaxID=1281767 RepID=A0A4R3KI60_9BACI|nr:SDR family oxidoreductase [Tepidibacillus fermentans]TCS83116.1 3-oxoacyl-[acyl-carrier protein] reductase [Tepidibacillus fermentans]
MEERRIALITGGSTGLGKSSALRLAKDGFDIIINYQHNHEVAEQTVKQIENLGQQAIAIQGDVTKYDDLKQMFEKIEKNYGRIDVFIHSVGPFIRKRKTFYEMEISEVLAMVNGNLTSAMMTTSFVLPLMRKQRFGRIIYFGFHRASEVPAWPDRSAYAAAKVGLVSFCKSLAVEEAPFGITVNIICPSDIIGENKEKEIDEVLEIKDKESLRGRPGTGEDVARVVSFLSQEKSDFITGNCISVSGGLDIIHPISKQFQNK